MLDLNYRTKIVERKILDKFGNFYQVTFLVALKGGKLFWKVIKVEKLEIGDFKKENIVCLPYSCSDSSYFLLPALYSLDVFSPYLKNIFFTSQMTRAPSF